MLRLGVMAIQGGCTADSPVVSVTRIESESEAVAGDGAEASVAFHLMSSRTCRHRCQCSREREVLGVLGTLEVVLRAVPPVIRLLNVNSWHFVLAATEKIEFMIGSLGVFAFCWPRRFCTDSFWPGSVTQFRRNAATNAASLPAFNGFHFRLPNANQLTKLANSEFQMHFALFNLKIH